MKKIMITALTMSVIGTSVSAKNLDTYREEFYSNNLGQIESSVNSRVLDIREALGSTNSSAIRNLIDSETFRYDGITGIKKKPQTSGFFKNKMDGVVIKVLQDVKYGTPLAYDPEWSLQRYREEKKKIYGKQVIKLLNRGEFEKKDGRKISPLESFFGAIKSKLVDAKKDSKKADVVNPEKVHAMKSELAEFIADNSPINKNGQSITDLLGPIKSIEVNEGIVHKIKFSKDNVTVPAQLSMMVSFKSNEDDFYVEIQDILVKYLKEQNRVFKKRIELKTESNFKGFIKNLWKSYVVGISNAEKEGDIEKSAYEQKHILDKMVNNERANYFKEGVILFGDNEVGVLKKRIALNKSIIPFMEKTHADSKAINKKLKSLSKEQVDFLLDLFLSLRGNDIVTDLEMYGVDGDETSLTRVMGNKISEIEAEIGQLISGQDELSLDQEKAYKVLKAKKSELKTDYYFYKIQADQLYRLMKTLEADKKLEQASQDRINEL